MLPNIIKVSPLADYTLAIEFDNGEKGILDMKEYLEFGVFKKLKDLSEFSRVKIVFDTIEWDSGPDLDPEFIYNKTVKSN
jgi:hypothetical protein